jgi:hypothetical protein
VRVTTPKTAEHPKSATGLMAAAATLRPQTARGVAPVKARSAKAIAAPAARLIALQVIHAPFEGASFTGDDG